MEGKAQLLLICGLPGSGKTTLARTLEYRRAAVRLSADEWMTALAVNLYDEAVRGRVEALQWKLGKRLLQLGQTVIVEWGSWGRWERDALRTEARELGAGAELFYLTAAPETLFARIQQQAMEDPPITWEQLQHWGALFEPPTAEEAALFDVYVSPGQGETETPH